MTSWLRIQRRAVGSCFRNFDDFVSSSSISVDVNIVKQVYSTVCSDIPISADFLCISDGKRLDVFHLASQSIEVIDVFSLNAMKYATGQSTPGVLSLET